jgi:hypothetical protein
MQKKAANEGLYPKACIASIALAIPKMLMNLRRLYASMCKLISLGLIEELAKSGSDLPAL